MSDELLKFKSDQVAGFYKRLADQVDKNKGELKSSLAATLMRQWLTNRDPKSTFVFDPPTHLCTHTNVIEVLEYHRAVYLTEQKASFTGGTSKWAGVIPRLQGKAPYKKWDGAGALNMEYQSLVELPLRYQLTGSDADRDLLYALHGFQLKTNVTVIVKPVPRSIQLKLTFTTFQARVIDRYDWDYSEHLKVPNPDFNSKDPSAVAPSSNTVVVYHSNAKRVEDAKLAAPYNLESSPWIVTNVSMTAPAEINPNKIL